VTPSGSFYYEAVSGGQLAYWQTASFDLNTGRVLSPPITVGRTTTQWYGVWSRDGRYFAYIKAGITAEARPPVVTILTAETGMSRELGTDCLLRANGGVSWAPDGHTLAATGTGGLCVIDAQSGQVSAVKVTGRPGESLRGAEFSPDQAKLYIQTLSSRADGGDGSVAFLEKDLASGSQREIVRRPGARELDAWHLSPDGRSIGVVSHDVVNKTAAVLLIPVAGGEPKELFRRPEADLWNLAFSPDGKYIGTVAYGATNWAPTLFIPTAGGEPRELLTATPPRIATWGMFAPDSRSVFLQKKTTSGEQTELWRVPMDGGPAVKLDINMNLDHIGAGPSLSPDGSQIAFLRRDDRPRKSEIWVLENFLSSIPASK
jgi:Tol biopolymer transport system component